MTQFVVFLTMSAGFAFFAGCTDKGYHTGTPAQAIQNLISEPNLPPSATPVPFTSTQPSLSVQNEIIQAYAKILTRYVDSQGDVDFTHLRRNRPLLKEVLNRLAVVDTAEFQQWSQEDQMAFWINAYNLQALKIVTDHYPLRGSRWQPYSTATHKTL